MVGLGFIGLRAQEGEWLGLNLFVWSWAFLHLAQEPLSFKDLGILKDCEQHRKVKV